MSRQFLNHPSLTHATDIKHLCEPLQSLNITTFSHLRVFANHKLTVQCNHPHFLMNYLTKKFYLADPCVQVNSETTDFGEYIIWDAINCAGKTAEMLAESTAFDFKHVFTIIKKQNKYIDFYHFGTHLSNPSIHQTYINNLEVLNQFTLFFNAKIEQSKALSEAYNIILNSDQVVSNESTYSSNLFIKKQLRDELLAKISIPLEKQLLTIKETQCVELLLKGYTIKEIAKELGYSPRTIEDRINSLKNKFNAKNKASLIVQLAEKLSRLN